MLELAIVIGILLGIFLISLLGMTLHIIIFTVAAAAAVIAVVCWVKYDHYHEG